MINWKSVLTGELLIGKHPAKVGCKLLPSCVPGMVYWSVFGGYRYNVQTRILFKVDNHLKGTKKALTKCLKMDNHKRTGCMLVRKHRPNLPNSLATYQFSTNKSFPRKIFIYFNKHEDRRPF